MAEPRRPLPNRALLRSRVLLAPLVAVGLVISSGITDASIAGAQASPSVDRALAALGNVEPGPAGLTSGDGDSWTIWAIKSVGGGLIGWGISKGFNEILVAAGADRTTNALKEMNAKLDQIKASLDQLHEKVDQLLKEVHEVNFRTAMAPVEHLEGRIWEAQNQFKAVLNLAGRPDKHSQVEAGIKDITNLVNSDLAPDYAVIPKALLGSAGQTSAYQLFASYVASQRSLFTWRDSAAVDNFFQYLVNLQTIQFNLIAQVRSLTPDLWPPSCPEPPEPPDPKCSQSIYTAYGRPYLGPKADVLAVAQGTAKATKSGTLFEETQREFKLLPKGAVLQPASRTEWSIDAASGAKELAVTPSGSGHPVCKGSEPRSRVPCLADLANDTVGVSSYRSSSSHAAQIASSLAKSGFGGAGEWNVPSLGQLQALLAGWTPAKGSAKSWLESEAGSDPSTCKAVSIGSGQAVTDENACLWPGAPARYWSTSASQPTQSVDWKPPQMALQSNIIQFDYGWRFSFFNLVNPAQEQCSLSATKVDWSGLIDRLHALDYQFRPKGPSLDLPHAEASCAGALVLVRQAPASERYY